MQAIFRTTVARARPARTFALRTAAFRPAQFRTVVTKRYTTDHEAIAFDDSTGIGTVSITDYAQSSLGDVVFVELPSEGTEVAQGDQIGAVESVKAASDIYAPVSGTVEAINEALSSEPSLLNKSPEDKGWLCKIKLSSPAELEELLTEEAYKAHCES
ncbi:glycine dehydrogenase [Coprinopsis cinerea okayama7|uniref:Glycine cleavage system H protein n=1 Tax=Coprinopsis cinerea (strain Okayama-7 / 130 / ATCC MYA-4618 / FGSC 9003) TaxID=240176 RepID=A8N1J5_COPC7|nr:glycine dehydrogenase [Coprinopsis cinerea okayama7\|eukprot:XP_001828775.1 glycine dehydrogenase [Coprinopsis cinerea okayama7\